MKDALYKAVSHAKNLDEVIHGVMEVFRVLDPLGPSGSFLYVSGVITSDGDMRVNLAEMARRTDEIKALCGQNIFAPTCVFPNALAQRMRDLRYRHEEWMAFWTKVIRSGYVGGVIMTPGWERSRGADIEFAIARNLGLAIYFYNDIDLCVVHGGGIL